jgi:hypothetical protein
MNDWEFGLAAEEIDDARMVFDAREQLEASVADAGVAPPSLEQRFEEGDDGEVLAAELAAQTTVLQTVSEARRAVERPRSAVEVIGLWGNDPNGAFEQAVLAVTEGELGAAQEAATLAQQSIGRAADGGLVRIGVALLAVVAGGLVGWIARRARRARATADEPIEASAA